MCRTIYSFKEKSMIHTVMYSRNKKGKITFSEIGWKGIRIKRDINDLLQIGEEVHLKPEGGCFDIIERK